jgi:hypothetical protein
LAAACSKFNGAAGAGAAAGVGVAADAAAAGVAAAAHAGDGAAGAKFRDLTAGLTKDFCKAEPPIDQPLACCETGPLTRS